MMTRMWIAFVAMSSMVAVSCGESGDTTEGATTDQSEAAIGCTESPRPELGAPDGWLVCADSGLMPAVDDFAFENWGGPSASASFSPAVMVSMFGYDNVCMPDATGCVMYPAAQQWSDQMSAAIEGGRCEGMATLSQRLLEGRDSATDLQAGATSAAELSRDSELVGSSIAKWWASQTFDRVRETTEPTRDWAPSRIVDEVASALLSRSGPTVGLYGNGQAHAVTPVAVSTDGAGSYILHVYDNNYPGRILPLNVDANAETWSYDMAAANAGEEAEVWSGGTGTLDLTLMDSREAPPAAPWTDGSAMKGSTVVTISSRGASVVGLRVATATTTVDTRDPSTWTDGIGVFPILGATVGTGVSVVVSPSAGRTKVTPYVDATSGGAAIPVVMTLDQPGRGSTQIESEIASDVSEGDALEFSFDGSGDAYSLEVDGAGEFDLEYAFGEEEADYDLSGDVTFRVEEGDDASDLSLLDSDGNEVWESAFDGEDDDGVYGSFDITYDEDSGNIEESETAFDSYDIPVESEDSNDQSAVDSTDAPTDSSNATDGTDPSSGGESGSSDDGGSAGDGDSASPTDETSP